MLFCSVHAKTPFKCNKGHFSVWDDVLPNIMCLELQGFFESNKYQKGNLTEISKKLLKSNNT